MYSECGCGHHGHHGHECGGYGGIHRRFISRKERIKQLEEYAESLRDELAGVEEELKELSGVQ